MTRLSHSDYDVCSKAAQELYAETSLDRFPEKLLLLLARVVPVEHLTFNEFNERRSRYIVRIHPEVPEMQPLVPRLATYLHEHPLYEHYLQRGLEPKKISDLATTRQFRASGIYNEVYRHLATKHQMIFCCKTGDGDTRIALALNRWQRDFSERDRKVLTFLSPHITQAYKNAHVLAQTALNLERIGEGLDSMHRAVILATTEGAIRWMSPIARTWLEEFFSEFRMKRQRIPAELQNWIRKTSRSSQQSRPNFSELQIQNGSDSRLIIYYGKTNTDEFLIVLTRECARIPQHLVKTFHLTPREAELLFWISEAKTNSEISTILQISPRTIHKHAQNLFAKIEVSNRQEAQRIGMELRTA